MQSFAWYVNRLRGMSPGEILWRVRSEARDVLDRYRFAAGWLPAAAQSLPDDYQPAFRVSDMALGEFCNGQAAATTAWRDRLIKHADEISSNRLSFFDLESHFMGDPIDWNRDHFSNKPAPLSYAPSIDYRDTRITGDCKLVWEPNRHHQFVVLARAFRATGDRRHADQLWKQMESWLDANPFGRGMNWRSGLELGIRLINWVWAIDLVRDDAPPPAALWRRIHEAMYLMCWETARKFSRGSSSNNHLVGEAAGVYFASTYLRRLPGFERFRAESRAIVEAEAIRQSYPDGCTREQAIGYQMFVLEFYLSCGLAGRRMGEDFSAEYWLRVEKMIEFLAFMWEGGDSLSYFGDCDDGYVVDLGRRPKDPNDLIAVGAVLFNRPDFKAIAGALREPVRWWLGAAGVQHWHSLAASASERLVSRAFADSGHYLLQGGRRGSRERISVLFDCGELGYGPIAAHGHADSLSIVLRAFGADVLIDPGTYDYFTFPEWRRYFRSTRAHNTIEVDGKDQSTMLGPFLWGERANSRCVSWAPTAEGGSVTGEHDGYRSLASPLTHRRSVTLDASAGTVSIRDELESAGPHDIAMHFHVAPGVFAELNGGNSCRLALPHGRVTLELDPALRLELLDPSETPGPGWASAGYHRKAPTRTLVARARITGNSTFQTRIVVQPAAEAADSRTPAARGSVARPTQPTVAS
jgi:hypothetical protein